MTTQSNSINQRKTANSNISRQVNSIKEKKGIANSIKEEKGLANSIKQDEAFLPLHSTCAAITRSVMVKRPAEVKYTESLSFGSVAVASESGSSITKKRYVYL